ncbi:MAG: alpha/beta fold hydrolase [Acidimicrobiia bacterium]|nr:alpha/beta fold hydrolase [Acidimicrobiia bacterium]
MAIIPDNELRDLPDATALVVERVVAPVEGMHSVISGRAFKYVGPPGAAVRAVHDTAVGGVYAAIRRTALLLGAGAGALLARRLPATDPVSGSHTGSGVQAALNAVWGDELAARGSALAVSLSVRVDDGAVDLDPPALAAAYPEASDHVVVLLHGLGQTERCWQSSSDNGARSVHARLTAEAGTTPVLVRYNSGRSVADTGAELADLIAALSENWPVAHPRVSIVGYSMGGLVARSAYATGVSSGSVWARRAGDLITIGAPHHGSPIASGVRLGSRALRIARTSRPLSDFLETASAGIRDLEHGAAVARVWEDASAIPPGDSAGIRQHFVAAVVTGEPAHPFGVLVGDLVVRVSSASGHTLAPDNVHVLGSRRHFDLLSDSEVVGQIMEWLTG